MIACGWSVGGGGYMSSLSVSHHTGPIRGTRLLVHCHLLDDLLKSATMHKMASVSPTLTLNLAILG